MFLFGFEFLPKHKQIQGKEGVGGTVLHFLVLVRDLAQIGCGTGLVGIVFGLLGTASCLQSTKLSRKQSGDDRPKRGAGYCFI